MSETYTEVGWKDGQDGGTPVSAANLKHMDEGIASAFSNIGILSQLDTTATGSAVEAINEVNANVTNKTNLLLSSDSTKSIKFGIDSDGNYGYYKDGADSVTPFSSKRIYDLGTGTSFDVTSYPKYSSFTADNFIVEPEDCSISASDGLRVTGAVAYAYTTLTKTYSDGVLTAYQVVKAKQAGADGDVATTTKNVSVRAYLIIG